MKILVITIVLSFVLPISCLACSGVFIANDEVKLFSLNEDFYNYNTFFATLPTNSSNFGLIGFGHSNSIQAIVNERGLCYDGYGAPPQEINNPNDLPVNNGTFIMDAMTTCETVVEVEELFNQFYHPWLSNSQVFFADRFGNSAIFEGNTVIHKTGDFQICTNFYQSDPESGIPYGFYPCWRYELLERELQNCDNYSVGFVRTLLDSVHVENQECPMGLISTVYSLIIDLNNNQIHVYNLHDFEEEVILNIEEELSKPTQNMTLSQLFDVSAEENISEINPLSAKVFPNPYRLNNLSRSNSVSISFFLKHESEVSIQLFNIKGEMIRTLINCRKPAGENIVQWNGEDSKGMSVSSGIYLYKISANRMRDAGKIIIFK